MPTRTLSPLFLRSPRPAIALGVVVAALAVALETLAIYPLAHLAPVVSLGVVYLIGVVVVSTYWGIQLGFATAIVSALAYNYFHLPPIGRLTLADDRNWVALASFLVVAAATGLVAELARARAEEADRRRREADLATEMARTLLVGASVQDALAVAAQRLAAAIGAASAAIELDVVAGDERRAAFPLREDERVIGTLVLPASFAAARSRAHRRADRARAAVGARGCAASRGTAGGGRRDGGAAPQRRDEDGAAALGLPRPAHAADGDPHRRRGARAPKPRSRAGRGGPRGRAGGRDAPGGTGREAARPLAPAVRRANRSMSRHTRWRRW